MEAKAPAVKKSHISPKWGGPGKLYDGAYQAVKDVPEREFKLLLKVFKDKLS